jgi:hypothetical protein
VATGDAERQREGNGGKLLGGITGKGFMPGRSGNPGGMRPGTRSVTARLRDLLDKGEVGGKPIKDGRQVADLLSEVILKEALKGDYRFVAMILDRTEGKVPDSLTVNSDNAPRGVASIREFLHDGDREGNPAPVDPDDPDADPTPST